ncbi:hypothetical protein [Microbacterium sp. CIAB417]|uniref:hypothetical protein n=1 Tax=Microbacterium sp. CIAB417 TaxID=2860287 RepID=UPI001FAC9F97|nr:hypothetical protein [Microbacterium sp. CIAB417]
MTWTPDVWASREFLDDLRDWVASGVGEVVSMRRVKDRPWAAVWRVESESGVHFVKQNCPGQQQEARIVAVLARVDPERVVPPVAVDVDRDLLLTADQGPTVRASGGMDVAGWEVLVREAMLLARASVAHLGELAMTALDPADAEGYVECARDTWSIPAEFRPGVARALGEARAAGERVAELGLPLALDHNDLHDDNAFARDGRVRFFDFGDAVAASPLAALRVPLGVCARSLGAAEGDPRVQRVADAALEVWSDLAPLNRLRAALPDAHRLAALARAESWHRVFDSMPASAIPEDYREADADWLAEAGAETGAV